MSSPIGNYDASHLMQAVDMYVSNDRRNNEPSQAKRDYHTRNPDRWYRDDAYADDYLVLPQLAEVINEKIKAVVPDAKVYNGHKYSAPLRQYDDDDRAFVRALRQAYMFVAASAVVVYREQDMLPLCILAYDWDNKKYSLYSKNIDANLNNKTYKHATAHRKFARTKEALYKLIDKYVTLPSPQLGLYKKIHQVPKGLLDVDKKLIKSVNQANNQFHSMMSFNNLGSGFRPGSELYKLVSYMTDPEHVSDPAMRKVAADYLASCDNYVEFEIAPRDWMVAMLYQDVHGVTQVLYYTCSGVSRDDMKGCLRFFDIPSDRGLLPDAVSARFAKSMQDKGFGGPYTVPLTEFPYEAEANMHALMSVEPDNYIDGVGSRADDKTFLLEFPHNEQG